MIITTVIVIIIIIIIIILFIIVITTISSLVKSVSEIERKECVPGSGVDRGGSEAQW
jgi:ABC-type Na+ efflux pump permease subunit